MVNCTSATVKWLYGGKFPLQIRTLSSIINLTREPKARLSLATGKKVIYKNSVLVYQAEGAIFCVE